MSRIQATFQALQAQGKKGLIPFMTAGDPEPAWTVDLMHALADNGADVIELGVPFSDPMADGPVIQRASERALAKGVSLAQVLDNVAAFRRKNSHTPVVLMGYANPIERMGLEAFAQRAQAAGVDGVLVVDYPPEESGAFAAQMRAHELDPIFLLAPTSTDERIAAVAKLASGYVYYVSLKGVTGAAHLDLDSVAGKIPQIKRHVNVPVGVGFGIRDAQTAAAIGQVADAVVIGSRIIQLLEDATRDQDDQSAAKAVKSLAEFIAGIRVALDETAATRK
ncbi:tryptophan synthase subunit alpha [Pandoraea sp.]|uniref:tryptophan synthase subunit alpha n=1 Tax=Pandoraea sp. TaxID=1883445 RepID=UPI0011F8C218|nr:tryptophan synthase subunit alpha [Pandoraea sp.]TAL55220.1 MAG: tryptophan synthase subunit alpha [Pandoraea sp.]TAM18813.1 MAG: tryptophan synthase subunit alpha [Pandoraea sp.]